MVFGAVRAHRPQGSIGPWPAQGGLPAAGRGRMLGQRDRRPQRRQELERGRPLYPRGGSGAHGAERGNENEPATRIGKPGVRKWQTGPERPMKWGFLDVPEYRCDIAADGTWAITLRSPSMACP